MLNLPLFKDHFKQKNYCSKTEEAKFYLIPHSLPGNRLKKAKCREQNDLDYLVLKRH